MTWFLRRNRKVPLLARDEFGGDRYQRKLLRKRNAKRKDSACATQLAPAAQSASAALPSLTRGPHQRQAWFAQAALVALVAP